MTIRFVCSCGKHLKARDEMAARRSMCPQCGAPVGIPSGVPTHSGTAAAPMTPAERERHARARAATKAPATGAIAAASPKPAALEPHLVRLLTHRSQRRAVPPGRHLESRWQECLLYPLRAWKPCLSLAMLLAVVSIGVTFLTPLLVYQDARVQTRWLARLATALSLLASVGVPCSFLDAVLGSAVVGEVYYIVLNGGMLSVWLRSGVKWLVCFLAGPVVFAGLDLFYWLRCGDPGILDWLIVVELGLFAVSYWTLVLLALTDRGRLRDVNPIAVVDLAHRLGWRALLVIAGAACLLLGHLWFLLRGVIAIHTEPFEGITTLVGVWFSAMYCGTFFCRLLGLWCHRSRATQPRRRVVQSAMQAATGA